MLALLAIAALGVAAAIEAPKLSRSHGTAIAGAGSTAPGGVTVPTLAGQPLDAAEQKLDQLGLRPSEVGGGLFGVLIPSDWNVCETSPAAGSVVGPGSTVRLLIDRPGAC